MGGDKVVCPDSMWREEEFTMPNSHGVWGFMGGGGVTYCGKTVRYLIEFHAYEPFYPFECLAVGL